MKQTHTVMSAKVRKEIGADPEYSRCGLQGLHQDTIGSCGGRITREHAMINAGKKIQQQWAIIPCCARHHGVDQFQDAHTEAPKEMRVWVALNRATEDELLEYPRSNYVQARARLNQRYGLYAPPPVSAAAGILY